MFVRGRFHHGLDFTDGGHGFIGAELRHVRSFDSGDSGGRFDSHQRGFVSGQIAIRFGCRPGVRPVVVGAGGGHVDLGRSLRDAQQLRANPPNAENRAGTIQPDQCAGNYFVAIPLQRS